MHAVKIPWVGQTFALANCSDSGGKKSRIRRSKEERKSMVESFIKKYQNSNDGSFPSLNLTHKEVGGSFYTVREIVREIIQENRVLGPAKFTLDEQNNDQLFEQYPLGSISTKPPRELYLSSSETHFVANDHNCSVEELVNTASGQVNSRHQQLFDNGSCTNASLVDKEYNKPNSVTSSTHGSNEMPYTDVHISPKLEGEVEVLEEIVQSTASKVTPIATDVIVETFPIISAHEMKQGSDVRSDELCDLTIIPEEHEMKEVDIASATGKIDPMLERVESVLVEKQSSNSVDVESARNVVDPLVESLSFTSAGQSVKTEENKGVQVDASSSDVLTLQTSHHNQVVSGAEPKVVPSASYSQNSKSLSEVENDGTKADMDMRGTEEGKNSTLNRINLSESWEVETKKPETNPALAVIKAFITAFVKFWTQ